MSTSPNEITIDSVAYPLVSSAGKHYATTFPTLHIDGMPIISVEHTYGAAEKEAIVRATAAVRSYLTSGKHYSIIPDLTFDDQVQVLDLDTLDLSECAVELYGSRSTSHLVISREREGQPYLCFCIWDRALQRRVLDNLTQDQLRRYGGILEEYRAQFPLPVGNA
ncbi:MAG: hypothetical protein GY833_21680 [Aestuariibacter sp.]|nr:hypothetical protein [Aestuariibacter sp.]